MKKLLLILSFLVFLATTNSCDCGCDGNDYDGDDYSVTIFEKWSDIGKMDGYSLSETKYHLGIRYTNITDSSNLWVRKMIVVDGNVYHTYEKGKTYIFTPDNNHYETFGLSKSYKKIVEENKAKQEKIELEKNKFNKRKI